MMPESNSPVTRKTLIEKLDDWEDWASWEEFYRTYSDFVWHVAKKSGLSDEEASDVVQETFIGVAKNLQKKKFDTSQGSFKSYLLNQTRWRIIDQVRRRKKLQNHEANLYANESDDRLTAPLERLGDPLGHELEQLWDREWHNNIMNLALKRVRNMVSPRQFQIFSAYVIHGWSPEKIKAELGANAAHIYLTKHRVGKLLRKEAERLSQE